MKRETRLRPARGGRLFGPVAGLTPINPRPTGCGCANPACTLPIGRCFVCKHPVDNNRTYAVCAACDDAHAIRDRWTLDFGAIAARHQGDGERECFCPGWLWMNEEADGSFNVESCDACRALDDDLAAAEAMVARCGILAVEWT